MTEKSCLTTYTTQGNIAVITIDNPPVNAISKAVRMGIMKGVTTANADDTIGGIVLHSNGRTFTGGADITEFGKRNMEPSLPDVCAVLEQSDKPIVTVLHGTTLGGGLEIALSTHYRIASGTAIMGLPEVTLGLIPGAGGTQRLPRVIDMHTAIDVITTGKRLSATQAHALGLLHHIFTGTDTAQAGVDFIRPVVASRTPTIGTYKRAIVAPLTDTDIDTIRQTVVKKARGKNAPIKAFEAIVFGQTAGFVDGLKNERDIFLDLQKKDPQSRALRYAFFASRKANKIPNLPSDVYPKTIQKVGIVGLGTMGCGISMCFANAGFQVTSVEISQNALNSGYDRLKNQYANAVKTGTYSQDFADTSLKRITLSADLNALQDVDLVVEAIFEKMDIKQDVFAKIDAIVSANTIVASNTSYLDVNHMAQGISHPERFIGLHFFSPAHIMKLLEIVRPDGVSDITLQTAIAICKKLNKIGVVSGVCYGFIGNRMLQAYFKQAEYMVEDGASPYQVDSTLKSFGFAMGIFAVGDLAGIDIGYFSRRNQDSTRPAGMRYPGIADTVYKMGRLGRKTGQGWYDYTTNPRGEKDQTILDMLIAHRQDKNISPQDFSDGDIMWRILCALVNEGGHILSEKIAYRASDIDVVWLRGYGFPEYKGGPMFWADTVGLDKILDFVMEQNKTDSYNWQPAPILKKLVQENKTFADYDKGL